MAENTLIVTGGKIDEEPKIAAVAKAKLNQKFAVLEQDSEETQRLVGCGKVLGDQRVKIVDPELCTELKNGEIGEIWISGGPVGRKRLLAKNRSDRIFFFRRRSKKMRHNENI